MRDFNPQLHDEFFENAKDVKAGFIMEAPMMCMGKVDLDVLADKKTGEDAKHDEDIYDGTYLMPHGGSARVAYHQPTNTLCLIASKTSVNLRGERDTDGHIMADQEGLERSYVIAAYRLKDDGGNADRIKLKLREAMENYDLELGKRAKKHFGQCAASFKTPMSVDVNQASYTEIFTNGYAAYLLRRTKETEENGHVEDKSSAKFYASAKRHDGHFLPINFNGSRLSLNVSRISKSVVKQEDYAVARSMVDGHWGKVASRLWDQEPLYADEGVLFAAKKLKAGVSNYINDEKKYVLPTAAVVGAVMLKNPNFAFEAAVALTLTHTAMHKIADGGLHGYLYTYNKVKEARKRTNIEDYAFGEDASDYFKVHTRNNLQPEKIAPKMDMERFDAHDFVFLDSEQSGLMYNHQKPVDGLRPEDVRSLLLFGHQRGFTSTVGFLDKSTRFDAFQNGIMRTMHNQPDNKVVVYAQYQPELCTHEALRLPEVYIDQFEGGLIRLEYDQDADEFKDSVKMDTNVPRAQAIHEICHSQLFRGQSYTGADVKARSHDVMQGLFVPTVHENPFEDVNPILEDQKRSMYRGGQPFELPDADAIAPQEQVPLERNDDTLENG
ncbi:MAG: hypothetical protein ACRBCK_07745 [Alphaproteobacteria bacterium]